MKKLIILSGFIILVLNMYSQSNVDKSKISYIKNGDFEIVSKDNNGFGFCPGFGIRRDVNIAQSSGWQQNKVVASKVANGHAFPRKPMFFSLDPKDYPNNSNGRPIFYNQQVDGAKHGALTSVTCNCVKGYEYYPFGNCSRNFNDASSIMPFFANDISNYQDFNSEYYKNLAKPKPIFGQLGNTFNFVQSDALRKNIIVGMPLSHIDNGLPATLEQELRKPLARYKCTNDELVYVIEFDFMIPYKCDGMNGEIKVYLSGDNNEADLEIAKFDRSLLNSGNCTPGTWVTYAHEFTLDKDKFYKWVSISYESCTNLERTENGNATGSGSEANDGIFPNRFFVYLDNIKLTEKCMQDLYCNINSGDLDVIVSGTQLQDENDFLKITGMKNALSGKLELWNTQAQQVGQIDMTFPPKTIGYGLDGYSAGNYSYRLTLCTNCRQIIFTGIIQKLTSSFTHALVPVDIDVIALSSQGATPVVNGSVMRRCCSSNDLILSNITIDKTTTFESSENIIIGIGVNLVCPAELFLLAEKSVKGFSVNVTGGCASTNVHSIIQPCMPDADPDAEPLMPVFTNKTPLTKSTPSPSVISTVSLTNLNQSTFKEFVNISHSDNFISAIVHKLVLLKQVDIINQLGQIVDMVDYSELFINNDQFDFSTKKLKNGSYIMRFVLLTAVVSRKSLLYIKTISIL